MNFAYTVNPLPVYNVLLYNELLDITYGNHGPGTVPGLLRAFSPVITNSHYNIH